MVNTISFLFSSFPATGPHHPCPLACLETRKYRSPAPVAGSQSALALSIQRASTPQWQGFPLLSSFPRPAPVPLLLAFPGARGAGAAVRVRAGGRGAGTERGALPPLVSRALRSAAGTRSSSSRPHRPSLWTSLKHNSCPAALLGLPRMHSWHFTGRWALSLYNSKRVKSGTENDFWRR